MFDLRPAAIIRDLDLRRPIYKKTAAYGHFGRQEKEFTWESANRVDDLKSALSFELRSRTGVREVRVIIRVVPDVAGLDGKSFDYLVPDDTPGPGARRGDRARLRCTAGGYARG